MRYEDIVSYAPFAAALSGVPDHVITVDPPEHIERMARELQMETGHTLMECLAEAHRREAAREAILLRTRVEVLSVTGPTAKVFVDNWSLTQPVNVDIGMLTDATGLRPDQLEGRFLEAAVNCRARYAKDLIFADVRIGPEPSEDLTKGTL